MTATRPEPFSTALGRAVVGAILFAFPLLMTMEMWELGFQMDRLRLLLFLGVGIGLIFGLAYYSGFRETRGLLNDAVDTFAAIAIGFLVSIVLLALFGVYTLDEPFSASVGKTALQAIPAALGAVLARHQLMGSQTNEASTAAGSTYAGELFLMSAGALFIAFNVAPTEEMILISFQMDLPQTLLLAALSIALLHLVVFSLGFAGQESHDGQLRALAQFTIPGYAIALLVSLYVLWTFGRTDGLSPHEIVSTMIVLGFPAALGAALARLVV
ncbi:TIGR02587 family membrane protein [Brevundimonas sp. NIBR10]|uniref:TIGR02587 family membrane protein n=1 Tax=Brevundimonas sp. NIBR10 TaxID=3015997 RepID=UPI0022F1CC3D|nr:TIGR02587 family membrane protein [Brevundimonas sp. NIBR10]